MVLKTMQDGPRGGRADPRGRDPAAACQRAALPAASGEHGGPGHRERRGAGELDGFQWYCEHCGALLYEEFFELTDIEKQFPPVFERFFASQESAPASSAARCWSGLALTARISVGGRELAIDLAAAVDLAIPLRAARRAAAALRRARRQRATPRARRLHRRGGRRGQLQLRSRDPHPALQRHAHRGRRAPHPGAPGRLPRRAGRLHPCPAAVGDCAAGSQRGRGHRPGTGAG